MRTRVYCGHPSIRDHLGVEVHEQMSRSGGQSEARPPVIKSQASLVYIYRPTAIGIENRTCTCVNNRDVQELWFQQDGATCHTARATIDSLKDTLGDRLISRFGPVNWPTRSCDLTPLDYFLWGYVKSLVYADKPQTLDHLEDNIRHVIAEIRPQMLEKVIENWTSDWTTFEPAMTVICQKSYLKCNATRLSFE
ncbi:transposable element Tc3 transposase [Trichonephila clavipes]|uniref:Transposable element Tc3 transposase n=1 Tax=Trichonephila clavipes TaxID=2585209 RepID=A0A8X7BLU3_TRICX|nr:transposable element Tc3 transposase [Trichonephila clavipes]